MRNPNGSQKDAPVTVSFPIPRKAASTLRRMAVSRDRRLLDLGVLAVQINEGESIVLGIKLGKQRIKTPETCSEKLRKNAKRGRVCKKPSNCRNVATIHHMPNVRSSKFDQNPESTAKIELILEGNEKVRKNTLRSEREIREGNLFRSSNNILDTPQSDIPKSSHFTTSDSSEVPMNGQSSAAKLSEYQNEAHSNGSNTPDRSLKSGRSKNELQTTERQSCNASIESQASAAQTRSSPIYQRPYSVSPSSDTSSTSSEENFDIQHDNLIYNCFVDRSKYSAADMLKELAASHTRRKSTIVHSAEKRKPNTGISKSTTAKNLSHLSRDGDNNGKSKICGSYRDHVKNIRCNSITSLVSSTSTVNSTLKIPVTHTEQTGGLQDSGSTIVKSEITQAMSHHSTLSKQTIASQTKILKLNSSETAIYHAGRKVLWSSSNAFPQSSTSPAHSTDMFLQLSCTSSKPDSCLSNSVKTIAKPNCLTSCAATCNGTIKSSVCSTNCSDQKSDVKQPELVDDGDTLHSNSQTVVICTGGDSVPESLAVQITSTCATVSTKSECIPGKITFVPSESSSMTVVKNLTMARPAISATVAVAGTNTHTTWSNQQVSPTYIVGAQGQYGIYSTLYSSECNNNQLGQQSVAAAYVYPVSFLYPYLAMAQANGQNSVQNDIVDKQKVVIQSVTSSSETSLLTNKEDSKKCSETTGNLDSMPSGAVPAQTQFIDLASSMRYWQQLNLLYPARMQALSSANLSTNNAVCTSSVNTTSATFTDVTKSVSSTASAILCGTNTATNSNKSAAWDDESWDDKRKTKSLPGKLLCQQDLNENGAKHSDPALSQLSCNHEITSVDRVRHTEDHANESEKVVEASVPVFTETPPKLNFIHDSSIACVNVGNSSAFSGSHPAARKSANQMESASHPAKRKKLKKSL
ncbi:uncharacterized protein LOC141893837 [Acropora palmata]|uniref:uncharacterized protein LOC141893837 n=1 Tax=Acropora palmata TaxID=6131 RepID=UPI003DA05443